MMKLINCKFKCVAKQKGFTLIELLLVMGVAAVMGISLIQATKRDGELQLANATATQMNELSAAFSKQIALNYTTYIASPRTTITIADLQTSGLLPSFYLNRTPFGGAINMEVVSTGGSAPNLTGLITTTPWTDPLGNPRYDLLGSATRKIGAQGGVTYYSTTTVTGLNGGWGAVKGVSPGEFTFISAPGQLVSRAYVGAAGNDGVYLRRDGALPMLGNLDMGFHDINNAVNISAQGWVYANHIASNDATIGSIFSNYIRNTGGIDTAQITGIGTSSVANFEYLTARTRIDAGKVQLIDTVVEGAVCTPNGLVSKNTAGQILSCQSGVWAKQAFNSTTSYDATLSPGQYGVIKTTTVKHSFCAITSAAQSYWGANYSAYARCMVYRNANGTWTLDSATAVAFSAAYICNALCID